MFTDGDKEKLREWAMRHPNPKRQIIDLLERMEAGDRCVGKLSDLRHFLGFNKNPEIDALIERYAKAAGKSSTDLSPLWIAPK